jgi:hypothetical protein
MFRAGPGHSGFGEFAYPVHPDVPFLGFSVAKIGL